MGSHARPSTRGTASSRNVPGTTPLWGQPPSTRTSQSRPTKQLARIVTGTSHARRVGEQPEEDSGRTRERLRSTVWRLCDERSRAGPESDAEGHDQERHHLVRRGRSGVPLGFRDSPHPVAVGDLQRRAREPTPEPGTPHRGRGGARARAATTTPMPSQPGTADVPHRPRRARPRVPRDWNRGRSREARSRPRPEPRTATASSPCRLPPPTPKRRLPRIPPRPTGSSAGPRRGATGGSNSDGATPRRSDCPGRPPGRTGARTTGRRGSFGSPRTSRARSESERRFRAHADTMTTGRHETDASPPGVAT